VLRPGAWTTRPRSIRVATLLRRTDRYRHLDTRVTGRRVVHVARKFSATNFQLARTLHLRTPSKVLTRRTPRVMLSLRLSSQCSNLPTYDSNETASESNWRKMKPL